MSDVPMYAQAVDMIVVSEGCGDYVGSLDSE